MKNRKKSRILGFIMALTILFGSLSTTPVYASTKLTDTLKEAYLSTLEARTSWGDPADLCKSSVDTESIYQEYYKALTAYEEDGDSAYYGLAYSIASKSSKNGSTALGKPIDSVEYAVVGIPNEDGEPQVAVYKCDSTTWLKKVDGEYQITKVSRTIRALDDYETDITDSAIEEKVATLCEGYLAQASSNTSSDEVTQAVIGTVGSQIETKTWTGGTAVAKKAVAPKIILSACPENVKTDTVKISGLVVGRGDGLVSLTINNTEIPVNSKTGNWTATINLSEGSNALIIKAVNQSNLETTVERTIYYKAPVSAVTTHEKVNPPTIKITNIPTFASGDIVKIQGTVSDQSGTPPTMYVNGQQTTVSADGSWTADINLAKGDNEIVLKVVGSDGKEYTQKKKIRYTPKP